MNERRQTSDLIRQTKENCLVLCLESKTCTCTGERASDSRKRAGIEIRVRAHKKRARAGSFCGAVIRLKGFYVDQNLKISLGPKSSCGTRSGMHSTMRGRATHEQSADKLVQLATQQSLPLQQKSPPCLLKQNPRYFAVRTQNRTREDRSQDSAYSGSGELVAAAALTAAGA